MEMEEELALMLVKGAMKGSLDVISIRKKVMAEIAELCYQDGRSDAKEKFLDICIKAIENGEKLLGIIGGCLGKKGLASKDVLSLSSVVQQSSGKELSWLWTFEKGSFEIFTAPLKEASYLIVLGKAKTIPSIKLIAYKS
jgi:hypothetical protein